MEIYFNVEGRRYSVTLPEGATEVNVSILGSSKGENGKKPLIILTDWP